MTEAMSDLFSSLSLGTQSSLDSSLFGTIGGDATGDPAVEGLDELDQSNADQVSYFQSEFAPQSGAYDALGSLLGGVSADDPGTELEQELEGVSSSDPATGLEQQLAGLLGSGDGAESADDAFLSDGLPAPTYGSSGLLLAESGLFGSSGTDLFA
jgi:hypothetical protein